MSLDGIITSWNEGAEHVYGYSTEDAIGKPVSILAPSDLREETIRLSERVKKGEKITNYETIRQRKDGKRINVSFSLSPVFDIDKKLTAVSFISRDISERKKWF
jgi:PAS domain S-box-containing protein